MDEYTEINTLDGNQIITLQRILRLSKVNPPPDNELRNGIFNLCKYFVFLELIGEVGVYACQNSSFSISEAEYERLKLNHCRLGRNRDYIDTSACCNAVNML